MRTGLAAVRVGIVMFAIPFVFAWYPELLLIEEAVTITDDMGRRALIEGYSGEVEITALLVLGARLILALYLLASALTRFDRRDLARWEQLLRLVAAVLILWKTVPLMTLGLALGVGLMVLHAITARGVPARAPV